MNPANHSSDFWANIAKIVNFFRNTPRSGFLFCVCDNQRLIQEINRQIIEKAKSEGLNLGEVYVSHDDIDNILPILRKGAQKSPNGIIVNNLNELIERSDGGFVKDLNMGREILIEMDVPMVFWVSEENISRFANQATDLFNRRDRSVVYFSDLSDAPASMERLDEFYELGFKSSEDYNSLKLKIGLMEKQLEEAKRKNLPEERIAVEIAADLVELYLKASLYPEAYRLFETYENCFMNSSEIKFIYLCGKIYDKKSDWEKALTYYFKYEQVADGIELGNTYNNIGRIYRNRGQFDEALTYFMKSEEIHNKLKNQIELGRTYSNIGGIYRNKGQWDNALTYFIKSEQILNELEDRTGLAYTYNKIGSIYRKKGEWNKALAFIRKSEKIRIEVGDRAGLGRTYNSIGKLYSNTDQMENALMYFVKAEHIMIEVGDRAGLAYNYFNVGTLYNKTNDKQKADLYFILAGYIAKTIGIKYEFSSKWLCALNPLIEEMGEERFMEEGKRLCEERGIV